MTILNGLSASSACLPRRNLSGRQSGSFVWAVSIIMVIAMAIITVAALVVFVLVVF
jgi:hypothetical protein